mgnify:CR=1 FL=1
MPATIILIKTFLCVGAFISILGLLHPAKALLGQMLLENAFKAGGEQPWPGTDLRPIGKLQFPRLGIQKIILSNATGQAMAWGPAMCSNEAHKVGRHALRHPCWHFKIHTRLIAGGCWPCKTIVCMPACNVLGLGPGHTTINNLCWLNI